MRRKAATLVLAVVLLAALRPVDTYAAPACGPFDPIPDGWTCIQLFGRDSFGGAYFDTRSGVLLHFVRGVVGKTTDLMEELTAYTEENASARVFEGTVGGTKYRGYQLPDVRDWLIKERRRRDDEICPTCAPFPATAVFPRKNTDDELELPPPGARRLAIVLYESERSPLNLTAVLCDDAQEQRVRDLVLGAPRLTQRPVPNMGSPSVPSKWILGLPSRASLDQVLSHGTPPAGMFSGCNHLILVYYLSDRPDLEGVATFDGSGTLIGTRLRAARLGQ